MQQRVVVYLHDRLLIVPVRLVVLDLFDYEPKVGENPLMGVISFRYGVIAVSSLGDYLLSELLGMAKQTHFYHKALIYLHIIALAIWFRLAANVQDRGIN